MNLTLPTQDLHLLEDFLHQHFDRILRHGGENENKGHYQLIESVKYSLFSGGKRFRPAVGFLLGHAMNLHPKQLLPWLSAIECIHTYSLIHDDLPSMDNDSLRRGKPTNHVLFGEATALLAGDALLTEAFGLLSEYYFEIPEVGLKLVKVLSQAAGLNGMVGGQALDLGADMQNINAESAELIHHLKTGALIRAVTEGVAIIAQASPQEQSKATQFGAHLGFAFQLKDDLLDFDPQTLDPKNMACHLGQERIRDLLHSTSQQAHNELGFLGEKSIKPLMDIIDFNIQRNH